MEAKEKITDGITFQLSDVQPSGTPLTKADTQKCMSTFVGERVPHVFCAHQELVEKVDYHPLIAATVFAYGEHRPLVLSPEIIWTTIAQGVAYHINENAGTLRSEFVSFKGREELNIELDPNEFDSLESEWTELTKRFSEGIRRHVGDQYHDLLLNNFSRTTPHERIVSQIVMMDAFRRYFDYVYAIICGIPKITLLGTVDDWKLLKSKVAQLKKLDLEWWVKHLNPICDEFINAARGRVNRKHWENICILSESYGNPVINGWITHLIAYARTNHEHHPLERNPVFDGEETTSWNFPSAISKAPVVVKRGRTASTKNLVGGVIGIRQHDDLALEPVLGWGLMDGDRFDQAICVVKDQHLPSAPFDGDLRDSSWRQLGSMPGDLGRFYLECNGDELFECAGRSRFRILPFDELHEFEYERPPGFDWKHTQRFSSWYRICLVTDGGYFAIQMSPRSQDSFGRWLWPVAYCTGDRPSLDDPIVAWSFTELLEKLLKSDGRVFSLTKDYAPYCVVADLSKDSHVDPSDDSP